MVPRNPVTQTFLTDRNTFFRRVEEILWYGISKSTPNPNGLEVLFCLAWFPLGNIRLRFSLYRIAYSI